MCIWDPRQDVYVSASIAAGDMWEGNIVAQMMDVVRHFGKPGL